MRWDAPGSGYPTAAAQPFPWKMCTESVYREYRWTEVVGRLFFDTGWLLKHTVSTVNPRRSRYKLIFPAYGSWEFHTLEKKKKKTPTGLRWYSPLKTWKLQLMSMNLLFIYQCLSTWSGMSSSNIFCIRECTNSIANKYKSYKSCKPAFSTTSENHLELLWSDQPSMNEA